MPFKTRSHSPNPDCWQERERRKEGVVIVNLVSPSRRGSGRHFEAPEEYAGYRVLDPKGRKIGSVKELFVSADDGVKYVEVKMGLLGLQSVLIPVGLVAVDDERRVLLLR